MEWLINDTCWRAYSLYELFHLGHRCEASDVELASRRYGTPDLRKLCTPSMTVFRYYDSITAFVLAGWCLFVRIIVP